MAFLSRMYSNVGVDVAQTKEGWQGLLSSEASEAAVDNAMEDMLEAVVAAEMYCIEYSAKEQPHAQGLLHTLHDAMLRAEKFNSGESLDRSCEDAARRLLQQLVAATNRRMHRGFPTIYAYLQGRPNHYASHEFVKYHFGWPYSQMLKVIFSACHVQADVDTEASACVKDERSEVVDGAEKQTALDAFLSHQCGSGQHAAQDAVRSAVARRTVTNIEYDYEWRPDVFENFPLYLFQAATDVATNRIRHGTFLWHEKGLETPPDERRHPCYKQSLQNPSLCVRSRLVKDKRGVGAALPRSDGDGCWYDYNHYRVLRTHRPWRVPILYGRMPRKPDDKSNAEDRGRYAVFMMLMFRPWRSVQEVRKWAGASIGSGVIEWVWEALFLEFLRWRREIILLAQPFFSVTHESDVCL
eukprot:4217739-Karenia_brevis.AAC.1